MDVQPLTQADMLALIKRTTDDAWFASMQGNPDGRAIQNAQTAIAARASAALNRMAAACTISDAPAGTPGDCTLTLHRGIVGRTGVIPRGFPFVTSLGTVLIVAQDTPVASGALDVALPLVTLRVNDLVNTATNAFDDALAVGDFPDAILYSVAGVLDSAGELLLGPTPTWIDPITGAGYGAGVQTLTYGSSTPIENGELDWLSVHGAERGSQRMPGESAGDYRARVRQIPDAVAPKALSRYLQAASPLLPPVWIVEPFDDGASPNLKSLLQLAADPGLWWDDGFWDDCVGVILDPVTHPGPSSSGDLCGLREHRAYFRVDLWGPLQDPDGLVFYLDDGFWDDEVWGYPDIVEHPEIMAALQVVLDEARTKRAAGVQEDVYLENGVVVPEAGAITGTSSAAIGTLVWTVQSDPSVAWNLSRYAWLYRDGIVGHAPASAAIAHSLTFYFSTGGNWSTPLFYGEQAEHLTLAYLTDLGFPNKPIVKIEGSVLSDGSTSVNLTGTFYVTPFTL